MSATLTLARTVTEVPMPPAPPDGYEVGGFAVVSAGGPYPSTDDIPRLDDESISDALSRAVDRWVGAGTERSTLVAVAAAEVDGGRCVLTAEWKPNPRKWGVWKPA